MKAMIFAAGLGTRLRPLTDTIPKALIPLRDKPLIQWVIEKIIRTGYSEIVVNVHHFSGMIREFLEKNDNFGVTIHLSDESDALLDTGGGLLKAAPLLAGTEPILLHNVDIISNLDLNHLLAYHRSHRSLATLVVRERKTNRCLLFNHELLLTGWKNLETGEVREIIPGSTLTSHPLAFSGIHIIEPDFLSGMTGSGKFSLIDTYLQMAASSPIRGFKDDSTVWMDVGKPEQLAEAEKMLREGKLE